MADHYYLLTPRAPDQEEIRKLREQNGCSLIEALETLRKQDRRDRLKTLQHYTRLGVSSAEDVQMALHDLIQMMIDET